jgi:phospholipid/cholesterol/gamma-HCH transport system ATP-binding protein
MIKVENIYKRYNGQQVLEGISIAIRQSQVTAIVGGSGEGKSVLLRIMMGLEQPDKGAVYIEGEDIVGMRPKDLNRIRKRFGVLFQDAALFDYLTVGENVAFPIREHLSLPEKKIQEVVAQKLGEVGLEGEQDKLVGELSGGMRKRVGLARAMALDPQLIFFDEPTSGLDPVTAAHIYDLIIKTSGERPVTYVIVTHDVKGVLEFSDKLIMIRGGKVISQATPDEIISDKNHPIQKFMAGKEPE